MFPTESMTESTQTEPETTFPPELLDKVAQLPAEPGVYLFRNAQSQIIYVGKAKSLRARVKSYFQTLDSSQFKTAFLVRRIAGVDYIVTRNEKEAFLLENTLIKKHKPRYNVRLRDDKDYVSLRIDTRAQWPRIEIVRRPTSKEGLVFGPYTNAGAVRDTLQSLQRIFPLRSCTNGKFAQYRQRERPCMEYQLRKCSGPCADLVSKQDYDELVQQSIQFLRGKRTELVQELEAAMVRAAEREEFETAARLRDQVRAIEHTLTRQNVARVTGADSHVLGMHREGELVAIVVLMLQEGKLEEKEEYFFPDLPEDAETILSDFISQYYLASARDEQQSTARAARILPREIVLPLDLPDQDVLADMLSEAAGRQVSLIAPRRGNRVELRDTAGRNAIESLRRSKDEDNLSEAPLRMLQDKLRLATLPRRIECFDISNTMGTGAVGSMVVFRDGKPEPSAYRRFRIKTISGPDDYAMMGEVLRRRLQRGREEGDLPDLLIVDGGKGQLAVAVHVLKSLELELDVVGLAKARLDEADLYEKEVSYSDERVFKPNRKNPVVLPRNSSALHLITHVRDEAHRFAITYHRLLRRKGIRSRLADIPGIGPKRQKALLRHFGSVRALKEADAEALLRVPGITPAVAEGLYAFLHAEEEAEVPPEAIDQE